MKLLKSLISFMAPLMIILLTLSVYLLVNKVVNNCKQNITNDYALVVITNTPMVKIDEIAGVKIKDTEILRRENIIKNVQENLSESTLKLLQTKLPYFYKIYLEEFPTTNKLDQIRKELTTISNIKKVETFSSDHNKIYSLLVLIQDIVVVLFIIVTLLSALLISKQIKIWFYEHKQRIEIIQLHGGSLLYSSKPIFNLMITSSIVSAVVVSVSVYLLLHNISLIVQPEILTLIPDIIFLKMEIIKVVVAAFVIPFVIYFGLIFKYKLR